MGSVARVQGSSPPPAPGTDGGKTLTTSESFTNKQKSSPKVKAKKTEPKVMSEQS